MTVTGSQPVAPPASTGRSGRVPPMPAVLPAACVGLTVIGLLLRLPALGDSLFGDELSSYLVVMGAPGDPVVDLGALTPGPPNETERPRLR